jgi:hypothetical protein
MHQVRTRSSIQPKTAETATERKTPHAEFSFAITVSSATCAEAS